MLSLVTVSPVITPFHSCCLSRHVFDQVNLWPAWVGFETAIFWQCSPGTVETQRLYPLRPSAPRAPKGDHSWIFWSYKSNYLLSLLLYLFSSEISSGVHYLEITMEFVPVLPFLDRVKKSSKKIKKRVVLNTRIYIYIYIYCHSQLISVVRNARCFKLGSKPG